MELNGLIAAAMVHSHAVTTKGRSSLQYVSPKGGNIGGGCRTCGAWHSQVIYGVTALAWSLTELRLKELGVVMVWGCPATSVVLGHRHGGTGERTLR